MRIKVTECQEVFTIGRTGENLVTEVEFPAYEGMRAALTYKRANDETPYPIALTGDEDGWVWTVTSTDLAQHGLGRCEVIYTEDEAVKLSRTWFVNVEESMEPAGEVPSGWESYYEDIIEAGNNAQEAATEAAASAAKIADMTVSAETLPEGSEATVEKSEVGGVYHLQFGIPVGATGAKGDTGNGIASITLNADYTLTITMTDGTSYTTESIRGAQGEKGDKGDAGFSPIANVTQSGDITTIEVTDEQGTTSAEIDLSEYMKKTDAWALLPTDTASGAVASFSDGADDVPMLALNVAVEPVQDLHGYDNPWPAGGGVNKLDASSENLIDYTASYRNYTYADGVVVTTGNTLMGFIAKVSPSTEYTASFVKTTTGSCNMRIREFSARPTAWEDDNFIAQTVNGSIASTTVNAVRSFTTTAETEYIIFALYTTQSIEVSKWQLELGSDATAWKPYENVCPISGWSAAEVTAAGKNLAFKTISGYQIVASGTISQNANYDLMVGKVKSGQSYTVTNGESGAVFAFYETEPQIGSVSYDGSRTVLSGNNTFSTPINGYVAVRIPHGYATPQIETGSTATAYEPYNGTTITHEFKDELGNTLTVYGGEDEVVGGKLRVTHGILDGLHNLRWYKSTASNRFFSYPFNMAAQFPNLYGVGGKTPVDMTCSHYATVDGDGGYAATYDYGISGSYWNGRNNLQINDLNAWNTMTAEEFAATLENVQLVYPLAEPLEYDLNREDIRTLYGDNTIFADCGDVEVTYKADIAKWVEKKLGS